MGRVFTYSPEYRCSILGRVILKKIILDASLLNDQVRIEGKMEQPREKRERFSVHLGVVVIENGPFESPSTTVANFTYIYIYIYAHTMW